jgi:DNA-binding NarL/FixJ family response regulator
MYKVVLVDDHPLMRNGLAAIIDSYEGFSVLFEADNGVDFINQLDAENLPDLVLLDVTMPEMDGFAAAKWIKENHPTIKVLVLSMNDDEFSIIRMLKLGARGYIVKNTKAKELLRALKEVMEIGFYLNEKINNKLADSVYRLATINSKDPIYSISDKEAEFLAHVCTDKTYKEIASDMFVSPRTVDGYRDSLLEKLNAKSRVGLVMFAIKNGIVKV